MRYINQSTIRVAISVGSLIAGMMLPFSLQAWSLPVGEFKFEAVAENVYVMHGPRSQPNPENLGFMNNPGLIVGPSGLILIDPGSTLQVGNKILEEVAKISSKPVIAVFNSHIHGDHWLGNQAVRRLYPQVDIYAHANTVSQALGSEGASWLSLMSRLTEGQSQGTEIVTANKTVQHGDLIIVAGEEFRIHALLPSHTDTDIMIEHVASRTIFTGDNCSKLRLGRFDGSSSIIGTIAALEYVLEQDFDLVVPGHGPSGDVNNALMPYLDYLRELRSGVAEGMEAELEDYEIKQKILPRFAHMTDWAEFDSLFGRNVNKMFLELEAF
jgi:glyoxylase-like metal-dependent hydrolase (beta-lactamase superfamily II)